MLLQKQKKFKRPVPTQDCVILKKHEIALFQTNPNDQSGKKIK